MTSTTPIISKSQGIATAMIVCIIIIENLSSRRKEKQTEKIIEQKKRELNLRAFVPSNEILEKIYNSELKLSRQTRIINKRLLDSNPQIRDILRSLF